MDRPETQDYFTKLSIELAEWSTHGQTARLFLRDDDAVEITPELIHLQKLTGSRNIPVLLAVIPKFAKCELREFTDKHQLMTPAVHGYSHENHAGKGEKKIELGAHRSVEEVLDSLNGAGIRMSEMFGDNLSKILVPPWNRIDADIVDGARNLGFSGISGFGWKTPDSEIAWVNTHVDIINWQKNSSAKSIVEVIDELTANLQIARSNAFAPIGILTHHLVHSQLCWHMLDEIFEYLCGHQNLKWVTADDLIISSDP